MLSYFMLHKKSFWFWAAVIFVILCVAMLGVAAYQNRFALNPDGVAYISIAEHYAQGNWGAAINAYWSPLLSWLMAPFITFGLNGQEAFAIVNFFTAAYILLFGSWLCWRVSASWKVTALYFLCAFPFMLHITVAQITPDALVAAWVLTAVAVFTYITRSWTPTASYNKILLLALITAAFGFVGYITKLYLQPVFIASIPLIAGIYIAYYYKEHRSKTVWRSAFFIAATLLAYAFFCLAWVVPLSLKYERPMIGSSYAFNTGDIDLPQTYTPLPLPHEAATTAWEDPTYLTEYKESRTETASESSLGATLVAQAKKVYYALPLYTANIGELWLFLFAPIVLGILYLLVRRKPSPLDLPILYSLLLFGVYYGGFAVRGGIGNHRYQWPMLILSFVLAALLSHFLWNMSTVKKAQPMKKLAIAVVLLVLPLSLFLQYARYPHHYILPNELPALELAARDMRSAQYIPPGSAIAASDFSTATHLAYYLDLKSYGTINPGLQISTKEAQGLLQEHDIKYFLDVVSTAQPDAYGKHIEVIASYELVDYCEGPCKLNVLKIKERE